ncbi:hypothetical protein BMS3Abin03_00657 [bacterium BMS3Abin03]|nr:hypothetical protein BMS3Abin03_00657 [bacterium BMS3Abin03]
MKKSCFIKSIIIFTIFLASALYIIENKISEFISNPGKKLINLMNEDNWKEKFRYIKNTPEKDSLKSLLLFYFNGKNSDEILSGEKSDDISKLIEKAFEDSLIEQSELKEIEELIQK